MLLSKADQKVNQPFRGPFLCWSVETWLKADQHVYFLPNIFKVYVKHFV